MTYFLTRAVIDRQAPEHSLRQLLDPTDMNQAPDAHRRLIWTLFPGSDKKRDFLWRADGAGKFLVVSARMPRPSRLFRPIEFKPYSPLMAEGERLAFVLRANATKDRRSVASEDVLGGTARKPRRHRRVDIVMNALHEMETNERNEGGESRASMRMKVAERARHWLGVQGNLRGFFLESLAVEDYRVSALKRRGGQDATFGVLDLKGTLTVRDPERLSQMLVTGLGRARAFGCGLMLVRRT